MAPAPYATVRTHIYYGLIRYCMRDQQSRGHGFPWPQLDHIAISLLFSLSLAFRLQAEASAFVCLALCSHIVS